MCKVICVVCNYNKCNFVVNCVKSLKEQSFKELKIIVVDNASTDNSVEMLKNEYGDTITIVQNTENKGGSGGFNAGLRVALNDESEYIMLIDNDVVFDTNCVEIMYNYMKSHLDVGILGPTVRMMKDPEKVQDLGGSINDKYNMIGNYSGEEDKNLPEELEVEYIATCAAMARTTAVRKFGLMPEDNFIYWDDVEWSKKCQLAGYRTVAINSPKVWHDFQTKNVTPFNLYYILRNKMNYFAKYIDEQDIEVFSEVAMKQIFAMLYGYRYKNSKELFDSINYALDDFLHGIRGKAAEYKLQPVINRATPFEKAIIDKKNIKINIIDNYVEENPTRIFEIVLYIAKNIKAITNVETVYVSGEGSSYSDEELNENLNYIKGRCLFRKELPEVVVVRDGKNYDAELQMCEHVRLVRDNILPKLYVDEYCNCITSESDLKYFGMFDEMEEFFISIFKPLFMQAVNKVRIGNNIL